MFFEPQTSLSVAKDVASIIGVVIAIFTFVFTLVKGVSEYVLQGAQKRFEQFLAMRKKLDEEPTFTTIIDALDEDSEKLKNPEAIPVGAKRHFLSFFEEIALMVNSGLMPLEVAHYMFGYYAIKCWDSAKFWHNMQDEKEDQYWSVFRDFVDQMREREAALKKTITTANKLKDKNKLHRFLQQRMRFGSFWTKLRDMMPKDDSHV